MSEAPLFRPTEWRQPTKGEQTCSVCHGAANFAEGAAWYCRICVPKGFLPKDRETALG